MGRAVRYVSAVLLSLFLLAPFAMSIFASVMPDAAILSRPPHWANFGFTLDNYRYILTGEIPAAYLDATQRTHAMISQEIRQLPQALLNSLEVALVVMILNVIFGSMAAYAIARLRFRGRMLAFNFLMGSRLIPVVALAIPYYSLIQAMRLLNNPIALVLMYLSLTLPFTVLFLIASFLRIDKSIEESARLDGLNPGQILLRVTAPLSAPALVGAGLFAFMLSYAEFFFGLLLATQQSNRMLPVTLGSVSVNPDVSLGMINAGIILGVLPTMIVVIPIWRLMLRGLTEGSGK
jgi:ABC-type glycerol-3-phosphate transport system permease component